LGDHQHHVDSRMKGCYVYVDGVRSTPNGQLLPRLLNPFTDSNPQLQGVCLMYLTRTHSIIFFW